MSSDEPRPGDSLPVSLVTATFALVALIACSEAKVPATSGEDPDPETTVTLLYHFPELGLPAQHFSPEKLLLYETLVSYDEEGHYAPRLARSWEHSEDYREWTYHLREDVRWHDGEPFTSRDVKFTVELFAHPVVAYYADLEEVLTPDEHTVIIRTTRPRRPDTFTVYYPEHRLGRLDPEGLWDWDFWDHPIGNGPFRVRHLVPRTVLQLEANDEHFAGRPAIDRVHLRLGGGDARMELLAGTIDVANLDPALLPEVETDPRFRVYHQIDPGPATLNAIWWNHDHPFLASAAVRRALTHAIDRRELQSVLGQPNFLPIVDVPYTSRHLIRGELPEPLGFDPARARELLKEAGWRDTNRDGIREKDGLAARLTALAPGTSAAGYQYAAVYVQAALRNVGVDMEIRLLPNPPREEVGSGEFEVAFDRFTLGWPPTWRQHLGYDNPRPEQLLALANRTGEVDGVDALIRQTWSDFSRDVPVTFLGQSVQTWVAHRRVRGLSTPLRADPYAWAHALTIDASAPR